jgi:3-keto steroid reductase
VARAELLRLLEAHIVKLKKRPGYDGHAERFRKNVVIDIVVLDLTEMGSVFKFAEEIRAK